MFGIFTSNAERESRAESLPLRRKLYFEYEAPAVLAAKLAIDLSAVLKLQTVSYRGYYSQGSYLLCTAYYNENCSEIYLNFEHYYKGSPEARSKFYTADAPLLLELIKQHK